MRRPTPTSRTPLSDCSLNDTTQRRGRSSKNRPQRLYGFQDAPVCTAGTRRLARRRRRATDDEFLSALMSRFPSRRCALGACGLPATTTRRPRTRRKTSGRRAASRRPCVGWCSPPRTTSRPMCVCRRRSPSPKVAGVEAVAVLIEILSHSGDDPLIPHIVWNNLQPARGEQ